MINLLAWLKRNGPFIHRTVALPCAIYLKRFAVATIGGWAVRPSTLHVNEIGNTDSHVEHQVFHQIRHMLREATAARQLTWVTVKQAETGIGNVLEMDTIPWTRNPAHHRHSGCGGDEGWTYGASYHGATCSLTNRVRYFVEEMKRQTNQ